MKQQQEKADQERACVDKAMPEVMKAIATAVRKAPAGGASQLGRLVREELEEQVLYRGGMDRLGIDVVKAVPIGTRADQLVRHLAFRLVAQEISDEVIDTADLIKRARAFGVQAKPIIDKAAPVEKPKPEVHTSAKPGKPTRGTCRKCGCQENTPCGGGCGWADRTQTRCTSCFPPTLKSRAKRKGRS